MSTMMLKVGMTPESFLMSIFNRALNIARFRSLLLLTVFAVTVFAVTKSVYIYKDPNLYSIIMVSVAGVYIISGFIASLILKRQIRAFDVETGVFGFPDYITVKDISNFEHKEYVSRWFVSEPDEKAAMAVYEHIRIISDAFTDFQELVNKCIRKHGKLTNYSAANLLIVSQGIIQHCRNNKNRCSPHQRGLPLFEFR